MVTTEERFHSSDTGEHASPFVTRFLKSFDKLEDHGLNIFYLLLFLFFSQRKK